VSISFWPYRQTRDLADKIDQTVNYSAVAEETKRFVHDQSVNLIETLADRLATHLLKTFPIQKVAVELRKFVLEDAKYVSVTVTRSASVG
jgi:dihydroneopterin aldolase